MSRVFVSHAAKDKALVEEFVDLLHLGVGIQPDDLFCSSIPGVGIPTGKDFVEYIKGKVQNPELVLFIISDEFLNSAFCLNEVGATWALSIPPYPLLVPPLEYSRLGGVLSGKQAAKLDDKSKLNDLRDDLIERLGITPYRTSHWERARDKFLVRLRDLTAGSPSVNTTVKSTPNGSAIVSSSGNLVKLHNSYFEAETVLRPDKNTIIIELSSGTPEEEVALERLRPQHGRGDKVAFAYQNDGGLVGIDSVTSTSRIGTHHWTVNATRVERHDSMYTEMDFQNHSADDIAAMRAGRLLINDPPSVKKKRGRDFGDDMIEYAIQGHGDGAVRIDGCIVSNVLNAKRPRTELAMKHARLEAVFRLKATRIVESIFELTLGPLTESSVHVKFRGERSRRGGEEPEVIVVEGDCELGHL